MIDRRTGIQSAQRFGMRSRQGGFLLNPARFGASGGGGDSDPYFSNVSLLLHMDGANNSTSFPDSSGAPKTIAAQVNAKVSTAQSKFGGASLLLDGTGSGTGSTVQSALTFASNTSVEFGTADFTIECFLYNKVIPPAFGTIIDFRPFAGNGRYPLLYVTPANSIGYFVNSAEVIVGGVATLNTWVHVALCRASGVTRLFVNGVQVGGNFTDPNSYLVSSVVAIGRSSNNGIYGGLNAHIDELRITKGVARYTAAFTPPSSPFPNS